MAESRGIWKRSIERNRKVFHPRVGWDLVYCSVVAVHFEGSKMRPIALVLLAQVLAAAALLPAMALAQPGLEQSGRWAVSGPWGHQAIHLALLRGDVTQHSKIVSFAFGW